MSNPHAVRLEEERRFLWKRKRAIKKFVENAHFLITDWIDRGHALRRAQVDLAWVERELERVCHALNRDPHPVVVQLSAPVRRKPVVRLDAPVRRSVQGIGYLTRDLSLR